MADRQKVVITGFGGRIARVLRENLGEKYEFSGIDRVSVDGPGSLTADLTNFDAILPAFQGKDVVIHLAAEPRHTTDIGWDILMPDNVVANLSYQQFINLVAFLKSRSAQEGLRQYPGTWWIAGPFGDDLETIYAPELQTDINKRIHPSQKVSQKWKPVEATSNGGVNFRNFYREEESTAYALAHLYSDADQSVSATF